MSDRVYWFHKDGAEVARRLIQMGQSWVTYGNNPVYQSWSRNMLAYYSGLLEPNSWDSSLVFQGAQGELVKMVVPQARSLVRQAVSLATKQKLAFSTVAETQGSDILRETRIGNALAAQIVTEQNLDKKDDTLCEMAFVYGGAFTHTSWRSDMGQPFTAEFDENTGNTNRIIYDGGLEIAIRSVWDVMYDYRIPEWEDQDWVRVATIKNRYSLLAQFPEMEREIMALPSVRKNSNFWTTESNSLEYDDHVFVYEAYHRKCPALPQGRLVVFASEECVLFDDDNPYGFIPVEPCMPETVHGMCFGFPMFSNLLGAQEMLDHSFSAIATNQSAFAVQNVTAPRGAAVSVEDIGGMNWLAFTPVANVQGGGKPEPLQLCASSPETFKFIDLLKAHMMEISNINSAIRGEPQGGVKAGVAIATLTANALEFMNSFIRARTICWERTMEKAVNVYREMAVLPQKVAMRGKNNITTMQSFTGKDLKPVKGVKFQVQNPLMQTLSGRAEVAQNLLQMGILKDVQSYFMVLDGAPTQELYSTELSEETLIDSENDALLNGKPVQIMNTDDHGKHFMKHIALLNDNDVRLNNEQAGRILEHAYEHVSAARAADPFVMALARTGKVPEGMPFGGPQQPAAPGAPEPEGGPMGGAGPQAMPPAEPAQDQAKDILNRGAA